MTCSHDRLVRLSVRGTDHWICTHCNCEFVAKDAVTWRLESLGSEVLRLQGIAAVAETLYSCLVECSAISPLYSEEAYSVIERYAAWKGDNDKASRMYGQEELPYST